MLASASETVVLHGPWPNVSQASCALRRVEGSEGIGSCFEYALTVDSDDCDWSAEALLGQQVGLTLALGARGRRTLWGIVSELAHQGYVGKQARYRLVLRPSLWLLSRNRDCRVFEQQSVPEILAELFAFHGLCDVEFRLSDGYRPRAQCVQYLESDLTFAQRLMHEEGLYYFFEHEPQRHVLVIADGAPAHAAAVGCETLAYRSGESRTHAGPVVHRWTSRQKLLAAGVALPRTEHEPLELDVSHSRVDASLRARHPVEIFDYPGTPMDYEEGARQSRLRLEELLAGYELCEGAADAVALYAGARFELEGAPRSLDNRAYLVVAQTFVLDRDPAAVDAAPRYYASLRALDASRSFRMQQLRKPQRIHGAQIARVVAAEPGAGQREDAVRVRFQWDRQARLARAGSCWAQLFVPGEHTACCRGERPRPGDDVLVEFLDGDPDRPVITARVRWAADADPRREPLRSRPRILRTSPGEPASCPATCPASCDAELPAPASAAL